MNTLFPLPESPSPRLLWLKERAITTFFTPAFQGDEEGWTAHVGPLGETLRDCERMKEDGRMRDGYTEDEAITRLAVAQGWKLWNMP